MQVFFLFILWAKLSARSQARLGAKLSARLWAKLGARLWAWFLSAG